MATTLHVSHERINYLDQCYMTEPPWETGWWIKSVWVSGNTSWMVQKGCSKNHLHFFFFSPLLHSLLLFLSELRWQCFDLSFFDDWQIDMLLKTGLGKKLTFFTPTLFSLTVRGSSQQTHHHPHQQQQTWKKDKQQAADISYQAFVSINNIWDQLSRCAAIPLCCRRLKLHFCIFVRVLEKENNVWQRLASLLCDCFPRKVLLSNLLTALRTFFPTQEHILSLLQSLSYLGLDRMLSCCLAPRATARCYSTHAQGMRE